MAKTNDGKSKKKSMDIKIVNYDGVNKALQQASVLPEEAIKRVLSDVRRRAPQWIADEVVATYNIKKSEITPSKTGKKKAGGISVSAKALDAVSFEYRGRYLTPVHFGMTPKTPPRGKSYTLKAEVRKGQKKVIGRYRNTRTKGGPFAQKSHNVLMGTGNTQEGGVDWIPFQRVSKKRKNLHVWKSLSMPEMITDREVSARIESVLADNIQKRVEHQMQQAFKDM